MRRTIAVPLFLMTACSDPVAMTRPDDVVAAHSLSAMHVTVVMSGLNSPRGLAWGPQGALYVAEAGTNASTGHCIPSFEGPTPVTRCFSGSGSISRYHQGRQERVITGLPSSFFVESGVASGPQDLSFQGIGNGYVAIGCGCPASERTGLGPSGHQLSTIIDFNPAGKWYVVADIGGYEETVNPAGGPVDSNPYGVLADGNGIWVVDAGGNSLLRTTKSGAVSFVTTFPSTPAPPPFNQSEPVPTKVKRGPDGALYISTLTGVPFLAGSAGMRVPSCFWRPVRPNLWPDLLQARPANQGACMASRIVARYTDGRIVKGTSMDVDIGRPLCHIRTPEGATQQVNLADLKALFFVKSLDGDPAHHEDLSPHPDDPRGRGATPVALHFADGEQISGLVIGFPPKRTFFYVIPVDASSNNIRILVNRGAVVRMEALPVSAA